MLKLDRLKCAFKLKCRPLIGAPDVRLGRRQVDFCRGSIRVVAVMEWGADTAAQPHAGCFLAFHTYSTKLSYLTSPSAIQSPTSSFLAQLHATLGVLCVLICEIQPGLSNTHTPGFPASSAVPPCPSFGQRRVELHFIRCGSHLRPKSRWSVLLLSAVNLHRRCMFRHRNHALQAHRVHCPDSYWICFQVFGWSPRPYKSTQRQPCVVGRLPVNPTSGHTYARARTSKLCLNS